VIITIDGPIATGKTTIAKNLAGKIGFIYFETGAMYRCATLALIRAGIDFRDEQMVADFMSHYDFDMRIHRRECRYYLENQDVTEEIRGHPVTNAVSAIAALPVVRQRLVAIQRTMAEGINAVFEGRDMGTAVFPNAYLKVFLTGKEEVRARRRYEEVCRRFPLEAEQITYEQVKREIAERDAYDTGRLTSPLRQPEDALVIDTSDMTIDEVVQLVIDYKDDMKVAQESKE